MLSKEALAEIKDINSKIFAWETSSFRTRLEELRSMYGRRPMTRTQQIERDGLIDEIESLYRSRGEWIKTYFSFTRDYVDCSQSPELLEKGTLRDVCKELSYLDNVIELLIKEGKVTWQRTRGQTINILFKQFSDQDVHRI